MSTTATYTTAQRSRAAEIGWAIRRMKPTPVSIAWQRVRPLLRSIDNRLARLLVCDLAEAVLPIFMAEHPDTDVLTHALAVARRYANGAATDKERLRAQDTLTPFMRDDDDMSGHYTRAECALGAVWFALRKEQCHFLEWGAFWAYYARHGRDDRAAFYLELAAALEGLQVVEYQRSA